MKEYFLSIFEKKEKNKKKKETSKYGNQTDEPDNTSLVLNTNWIRPGLLLIGRTIVTSINGKK